MTATGPVGSAYVVIRAITTGLKDDIEKGFEKGVKDADLEKVGKQAGDKVSDGFSSGIKGRDRDISTSLGSSISRGISRTNVARPLDSLGRKMSQFMSSGFGDDFDNRIKGINDKIGKGFAKIITGFSPPPIAWAVILAIPAIGGAAKIITAYLVGIIAQLGFVLTAAVAAGAALGGAFVGLAVGLGPLFLLLKTAGPTLDAFKESAKGLAAPWQELGVATQGIVFPALLDTLNLINDKFLPVFRPFITGVSEIAANFIRMAGTTLTTNENLFDLARIFQGSQSIIGKFGVIINKVFDALIPLFATIMPIAEQFVDAIDRMVDKWRDFIKAGSADGTLGATLQTWYDRLKLIMGALGNLAKGVWDVFKIGADAAAPMFETLSNIAQKFADWTSSAKGQTAIRDFFDKMIPVMQEVNTILGDIIKLIVKPLFEGNTSGIMEFLTLFDKEILPLLAEIARSITEELRGKVIKFTEALVKFIDQLVKAGALSSILDTLTTVLDLLTKLMEIPGMEAFITNMLGVVGSLSALNFVLGGFPEKIMGELIGFLFSLAQIHYLKMAVGLSKTGEAIAGVGTASEVAAPGLGAMLVPLGIAAGVIAAVAVVAVGFWAAFKFWKDIPTWVKAVIVVLGILTGGPIGLLAAAIIGIVAAIKNWREILGVLEEVGTAILEFFKSIPQHAQEALDFLEGLPDKIAGFLEGLPDTIINLVGTAFEELPKIILDAVTGAINSIADLGFVVGRWLMDQLGEALPEIAKFFAELPFKFVKWIIQGLVATVGIGTKIIGAILRALDGALPALAKWFGEFAKKIPGWIGDMAEVGFKLVSSLVKGLVKALPTLLKWFTELPGKILDFAGDSATWLLETGAKVIEGLLKGIVEGATGLFEYFTTLPDEIWNSLDSGLQDVLTNVGTWADNMLTAFVDFILGLPGAFTSFTGDLLHLILDPLGDVLVRVGTWVVNMLAKVGEFAAGVPGALANFATNLLSTIATATSDALTAIATWVTNALTKIGEFVAGIPGAIAGFASSLLGGITGGVNDALAEIGRFVTDGLTKIGDFVRDAPGKLLGLAGELTKAIGKALKDAWNEAISHLPEIHFHIPWPIDEDIDIVPADEFKMALGGIVPGSRFGTRIIAGEGGRAEAVIPLTRPARAAAILQEAGLLTGGSSTAQLVAALREAGVGQTLDRSVNIAALVMPVEHTPEDAAVGFHRKLDALQFLEQMV
jgi:hypothetical protein